jgi:hypothetical protein
VKVGNVEHPMSDKGEGRVKDFVSRGGPEKWSVFSLCAFALNVFRVFSVFRSFNPSRIAESVSIHPSQFLLCPSSAVALLRRVERTDPWLKRESCQTGPARFDGKPALGMGFLAKKPSGK